LPVGSMVAFPKGPVPVGFFEANGGLLSIAAYPDLAAYLGTTFNTGTEGAGNFRLPDSRGEFLRGWDNGRGVDAGRALGSSQADALKEHRHLGGVGSVWGGSVDPFVYGRTDVDTPGQANSFVTETASTGVNSQGYTSKVGESETRPRNLAVMWCIKAWNAPINQGQIDVAALANEVAALKSATPVGAIIPFPMGAVPAGYLELDGRVLSIAAYPDLASYLGSTFNTGGEGDGNFRLPDSRGEFLRGWDHGRGIDAGRVLSSYQDDAFQGHWHELYGELNSTTAGSAKSVPGTQIAKTALGANAVRTAVSDGVNGAPRTAAETRPRNLAVMWCIKAWSAPINQGSIDIGALSDLTGQATEIKLGTSRFGTPNEQVGGLLKDVMSNPAGVLALLASWFPKRVFSANDYIRIPDVPGGLILQWGTGSGTSFTFPIEFPNACFFVGGGEVTENNSNYYFADVVGSSRTGFSAQVYGGAVNSGPSSSSLPFKWLSVGN
jgi:microcystin-dependent protein